MFTHNQNELHNFVEKIVDYEIIRNIQTEFHC